MVLRGLGWLRELSKAAYQACSDPISPLEYVVTLYPCLTLYKGFHRRMFPFY